MRSVLGPLSWLSAEVARVLVRLGCPLQICNWMGQTSETLAREAGHDEVADFLEREQLRVGGRELSSQVMELLQEVGLTHVPSA